MAEPFLSEIRIFSFNYAPQGWAPCNGQFMPINQNQALFSLLGTTYGGNGQTTFALPNLRGRVPIHVSNAHNLGEAAGSTAVTVNIQQMPAHSHGLQATNVGATLDAPGGNFLAKTPISAYGSPASLVTMNAANVSSVGGSQPHNNMMPYLVLSFCIALIGIFPTPN